VASVDHLILQVTDGTNLQSLSSREFTTRDTKLHVRESSDIAQYTVTLSIKVNRTPIGEDHESYWANMDFLLRTYVSGDNSRSEYDIDRDFLVGDTVVNRPENFAGLTKSWFPVFVRNQPKIENKKFVLDFDVVPGITSEPGNLAELIFRYFGKRTGGPDLVHSLPMIKRMLVGLNVTTDYRFDEKNTDTLLQSPLGATFGLEKKTTSDRVLRAVSGNSDASPRRGSHTEYENGFDSDPKGKFGSLINTSSGLLNSMPNSPKSPFSPTITAGSNGVMGLVKSGHNIRCTIQDIKLPGDVPTFFKEGKKYSVLKYFNEGTRSFHNIWVI
jgi:hypothetical protein